MQCSADEISFMQGDDIYDTSSSCVSIIHDIYRIKDESLPVFKSKMT